ncbi:transmembrane protein 218 [Thalassophryne amazonica]|uniref:transmembrane protein 218 n=1 Tax=Thalassophryne amazonica TaxID=390379 RepID=UPI001470A7BB|nr:transmembrane protein 218 [Thalassophryne amazonica]
MSATVLGVGTGVFIIGVVWILAAVFGMMLLRAAGPTQLGVIPVFLLALLITLALVYFPRSPETPTTFKELKIVDTLFIGRYILLAVVSSIFLLAVFMLLPFHFLELVYAKPLKTR